MAQKKLGRGLGALVELAPASDDGTARIRETVRGAGSTSVLALSGHSVEEFFRAPVPAQNVALLVPSRGAAERACAAPAAAPVAPIPEDAAPAAVAESMDTHDDTPDDDAREIQHSLFDPPVEFASAEGVAETSPEPAVEAATAVAAAPADVPPPPAPVEDAGGLVADTILIDDEFVEVADIDEEPSPPAPPPPPIVAQKVAQNVAQKTAPVASPSPAPPAAVAAPAPPAFDDDVLFLDESVGGIVLPDVELE